MPYVYYNPNPYGKDTEDCVIRAISRLFDLSWDEAFIELTTQAFIDKSVLTVDNIWGNYLMTKGFTMHPLPNTCPRCYTVSRFAADHPYGRFLVKTPGHVIAVVDGYYYDSGDSGREVPIYYWEEGKPNRY